MELLQVKNLNFTYPKQTVPAVEQVSFSINRGEFCLLMGASGCGKTTLLRLLKSQIAPYGEKSGELLYRERSVSEANVAEIGFVGQNPDEQIVTDKVWHELAFGLENMGLSREVIRRRTAEMAGYFGIQDWYHKNTDALSGGQKQLLNLAAVMVMQPRLLLLDEPTAQLDPIAAADFIATLQKLNRELGLTVLLAEHRLEEIFPIADRVLVMEQGRLLYNDAPKAVCVHMKGDSLFAGLPAAARIWNGLQIACECPLTVREGRDFLDEYFSGITGSVPVSEQKNKNTPAIEANGIWFRYEKDAPDILRGLSLSVYEGEIFSILGGNGSGKTTTLHILAGLDRPYKGKCRIFGKKMSAYTGNSLYRNTLAMLPQNPKTMFVKSTVEADFCEILSAQNLPKAEQVPRIARLAQEFDITPLLHRHPYDLSGGQMQKCALVKLLLTEPKLLLLDEPTKGMDAFSKQKFGALLRRFRQSGMTVLLVSHDIEFAAEYSDRCGLFFDGEVLSSGAPNDFFAGIRFYTTAAGRIAGEHFENAVLCSEVISLCKGALSE